MTMINCCLSPGEQLCFFIVILRRKHVVPRRDDDHFHFEFEFYRDSAIKQQSTGRHIASTGHIILISSLNVQQCDNYTFPSL